MLPKNTKSIDIQFDVKVITQQTAAKLVLTLIQFLAYHRKQIPFPFSTFQMLVEKLPKPVLSQTENWTNSFQTDRQKTLAERTLNDFLTLGKVSSI